MRKIDGVAEEVEEEGLAWDAAAGTVPHLAMVAIITEEGDVEVEEEDRHFLPIVIGLIRTVGGLLLLGTITTIIRAGAVLGATGAEEEAEDCATDDQAVTIITKAPEVMVVEEEEEDAVIATGMDRLRMVAAMEEGGPWAGGTSESETSTDATRRRPPSDRLHSARGTMEVNTRRRRVIEAATRPPAARATRTPDGSRPARAATRQDQIARPGRGRGLIVRPDPRDHRRVTVVGAIPGRHRGATPARRLRSSVSAAVAVVIAARKRGSPPRVPRGRRRKPS